MGHPKVVKRKRCQWRCQSVAVAGEAMISMGVEEGRRPFSLSLLPKGEAHPDRARKSFPGVAFVIYAEEESWSPSYTRLGGLSLARPT